jgi:NAD(P)-dependent dehydrogenase (short-subunit alcohol dehydrogenase family)
MRILITGAAGFLGSHLCERMIREGHDVIGMDNFITGNPDNLAHLTGNKQFTFVRHDVANFIFVPGGKVDAVMHFASPASPNPLSPYGYTNLPIQTMKAGALGTHNTPWALPRPTTRAFCWHLPAKFTVTPWNIPKKRLTGDIAIQSAFVPFMMKPNASPRH